MKRLVLLVSLLSLCSPARADYLGSWKINDYVTFTAQTSSSTGAQTDADAVPTYDIYEDETGTPLVDSQNMAKLDDAGTTGFYSEQVQLTAATGFEKGKSYTVRIAATVGGVTGATTHNFQIEAEVDANTVTPTVSADVVSISGSSTAADNAEIVFATDFATNYSSALDRWNVNVATYADHQAPYIRAGTVDGNVSNGVTVTLVGMHNVDDFVGQEIVFYRTEDDAQSVPRSVISQEGDTVTLDAAVTLADLDTWVVYPGKHSIPNRDVTVADKTGFSLANNSITDDTFTAANPIADIADIDSKLNANFVQFVSSNNDDDTISTMRTLIEAAEDYAETAADQATVSANGIVAVDTKLGTPAGASFSADIAALPTAAENATTIWANGTRSLTDKADFELSSAGVTAVASAVADTWDGATVELTSEATNEIRDAVWEATSSSYGAGTLGAEVSQLDAQGIADALKETPAGGDPEADSVMDYMGRILRAAQTQ